MTDSITESRKETIGAMFNLLPLAPPLHQSSRTLSTPPPPPMVARPVLQTVSDSVRAPPPLKRMSANQSDDSGSPIEPLSDNEDIEPNSLFSQSSKKSSLDSILGKIIANRTTESDKSDISRSSSPAPQSLAKSASQTSSADSSSLVTPPPLQRFAPSPDSLKSRRKQATPQASNERETEMEDDTVDVTVPDIDDMLKNCSPVTSAARVMIDGNSDEDEEWTPMRVSRKGRVVKRPSWAEVYTDQGVIEPDDEWTPETKKKFSSDSFKPRAPPAVSKSALGKAHISHDDLHPSMVMEDPPAALLEPFKYGWIRELVIRNPQNVDIAHLERKHTAADTYYYAPKEFGSVKLRSVVKIQEFLFDMNVPNLSSDNFSFAKRAFYKAPEEFVRLAGKVGGRKMDVKSEKKSTGKSVKVKSESSTPCGTPPSMSAFLTSSATTSPETPPTPKPRPTSKSKSKTATPKTSPFRPIRAKREVSNGPSSQPMKKIRADKSALERAKQYLTNSSSNTTLNILPKTNTLKVLGPAGKPPSLKPPQPCTSNCVGVNKSTPTVQCGVCLLLYHQECINWSTSGKDALFVCSLCIMKSRKVPSGGVKSNVASESGAKANVSALPKEPPVNKDSSKSGRLITIPLHILNKIDTKSPFALKLNNETFKVDPSRLIRTENGVKIYIKDNVVLKPSEMPLPAEKEPPPAVLPAPLVPLLPRKKYKSLLDCYKEVSLRLERSDTSSKTPAAQPDKLLTVKKEPVDTPPPDIRNGLVIKKEPGTVDSEKLEKSAGEEPGGPSSSDLDLSEFSFRELRVQNILEDMLTSVVLYEQQVEESNQLNTSVKSSQKKVKEVKLAPAPTTHTSLSAQPDVSKAFKLNNLNKSAAGVESMSQILYDQNAKIAPKTYGRLACQTAKILAPQVGQISTPTMARVPGSQLFRSLVPKNGNYVVIPSLGTASPSPVIVAPKPRYTAPSSMPVRSLVISPGIASIGNSVAVSRSANGQLQIVKNTGANVAVSSPKIMVVNSPPTIRPQSIIPSTQLPGYTVRKNAECQTEKAPAPPVKLPLPTSVVGRPVNFSFTGDVYGVLLGVFRHLSVQDRLSASGVCRLWRAVSHDPSLRLPRFGFHPPEPLLKAIFDLNSLYVLSLDTVLAGAAQEEGSSWLSPQHLKRILNLPNLTSLHLAGGISSDDEFSLDSIATSPSLAHLSLQQFSAPHILKIVEVMAFTNPDALRRLDLKVAASQSGMMSEDEKTVDTELTGVLKRCTKVEELKLSYSRLDVDSCEAEYLKDTLSMTFPQTAVSVNLYD